REGERHRAETGSENAHDFLPLCRATVHAIASCRARMVPGAVVTREGRSVLAGLCERRFDFLPELVGRQRLVQQLAELLAFVALDRVLGVAGEVEDLDRWLAQHGHA